MPDRVVARAAYVSPEVQAARRARMAAAAQRMRADVRVTEMMLEMAEALQTVGPPLTPEAFLRRTE